MIELHLTIFQSDEGDQFRAHTIDPETGEPVDVTDQYELAATVDGDDASRTGFVVFPKRITEQRNPNGVEL